MLIPAKHSWLSQLPPDLPEVGNSVFVMFVSPSGAGTSTSTTMVVSSSGTGMTYEMVGPTGEKVSMPMNGMMMGGTNPFGMGMGMPMMGMGMGMGFPMMNPMFMPGKSAPRPSMFTWTCPNKLRGVFGSTTSPALQECA